MGLNNRILACKMCRDDRIIRPLPGAGNHKADIVIVGQNTCQPKCLEEGIPFSGGSGVLLVDALTAARLTREDVYISNVVKCATVGNLIPTGVMKANCRPFLISELRILKPRLVITLGKFAAENFPTGDYMVKNILHPAWYMRKGDSLGFVKKFLEAIKDGR
jgi:DNA polymerase